MRIPRLFTTTSADPFQGVTFSSVSVDIRNADGTRAFALDDVVVPSHWSGLAADILVRKYFRKSGVPVAVRRVPEDGVPEWLWRSEPDNDALDGMPDAEKFGAERDVRQVFGRLAGFWTYWGWKGGYFDTDSDARAFHDEMQRMLVLHTFAPNSPQWFNTGLHWAYGIEQSGNGYATIDPLSGNAGDAPLAYERAFIHSCFIQSIQDDLVRKDGVIDFIANEAKIAKFGAGTGANFSTLRGSNESLSSGGTSSGLLAALKASDRAAALVSSKGSTRQPSKMVIVDADHPEIFDYIDWKVAEERKVAALVSGSKLCNRYLEAIFNACDERDHNKSLSSKLRNNPRLRRAVGNARAHNIPDNAILSTIELAKHGGPWTHHDEYDANWDSDAYHSVSGQRSNNSIRIPDEFLDAVEADADWHLVNRTNNETARTVKAKDLWNKIGNAAWSSADPGVQFETTINQWHTCPQSGPINGSNSCSEFLFLDDTATTLACINLRAFAKDGLEMDLAAFEHAVRMITLMMEISVSAALYPSYTMAEKTDAYRPLGIGFTNLGGLLMSSGVPYDSDEGRVFCGAITALLTGLTYATSAKIAADVGPFRGFADNRNHMLRVIRNHHRAAYGKTEGYEDLSRLPTPLKGPSGVHRSLIDAARTAWDQALSLGQRHGFRNAQASVIAPTGTTSLILDCDTMGIEPDYALVKYKTLAGGGHLVMINQCVPEALRALDYNEDEIEKINHYVVGARTLSSAPYVNPDRLKKLGFTSQLITAAQDALETASSLETVFSPATLGVMSCEQAFGLPEALLSRPGFNLLRHLGFSAAEIRIANDHCFGHGTLEGAPGLNPRHLPVFDCSVPCGTNGTRSLSIMSHLQMMSAAQPFVSGAISKTVNVPGNTTLAACLDAFSTGAQLGLKAVAIYRDGSKLSQPLTSVASLPTEMHEEAPANDYEDQEDIEQAARRIVTSWLSDLSRHKSGGQNWPNQPVNVHTLSPPRNNDRADVREADASFRYDNHNRALIDTLVSSIAVGIRHGASTSDFEALFNAEPTITATAKDAQSEWERKLVS
ncbi:MAG: vitamin B12-dependent ribonucleotide reductase [Pseudomonadota bacterium]